MSAPNTPREISERMRREGTGVSSEEMKTIRESLAPEQLRRIRDKQAWEQCSFLAVLRDWPSLFDSEPSS